MSVPLYREDPYLKEFEATVTAVDGEWVALDRTAFYPGGGGQDPDTGWIEGLEVTEVGRRGHRVPGHSLSPGDEVRGRIDWARRYDLMRAHTGEHLLYSVLERMVDDLEMVKISITDEGKGFIVRGSIDRRVLGEAQERVNEAIREGIGVRRMEVARDDPVLDEVRIKLERIKGDTVSIVRIGDIDSAACAGVHVSSTSEIGAMLIDRFTSAGKGGWMIGFQVGDAAVRGALGLASVALDASDRMGSSPEDLPNAVTNLKEAMERRRVALRSYCRAALEALEADEVSGTEVFHGVYDCLDRKALKEAADRLSRRGICVLVSRDDTLSLVVAGEDARVDCREVVREALERFGGRGGGKEGFAQGGCSDVGAAEEIEALCVEAIGRRLAPSP